MARQIRQRDKSMISLLEAIIPSESLIKEGKECAQKVFETLKPNLGYIDRTKIAGSIGKGTEILYPDLDAVIFINNGEPPFVDEIEDCKSLLEGNRNKLNITAGEITSKGGSTIQFDFKSGFSMDLLPAANYVKQSNEGGLGGSQLALHQAKGVMEEMKEYNTKYSSSLSELQLDFVRKQDIFTRNCIRLSKFWFKSLYLQGNSIYGIKSILELISVAVIQRYNKDIAGSYWKFFIHFLDEITRVDEQRLIFDYNAQTKQWYCLSEPEISRYKRDPKTPEVVAKNYLSSNNFILEPANVYNNFAINLTRNMQALEDLKSFAEKSILRCELGSGVHLYEVLDPQPRGLLDAHLKSFFCRIDRFSTQIMPVIEGINNLQADLKGIVRGAMTFLINTSKLAEASNPNIATRGVKRALVGLIENNILNGGYHFRRQSIKKTDEPFDAIIFIIPVASGGVVKIYLWVQ